MARQLTEKNRATSLIIGYFPILNTFQVPVPYLKWTLLIKTYMDLLAFVVFSLSLLAEIRCHGVQPIRRRWRWHRHKKTFTMSYRGISTSRLRNVRSGMYSYAILLHSSGCRKITTALHFEPDGWIGAKVDGKPCEQVAGTMFDNYICSFSLLG